MKNDTKWKETALNVVKSSAKATFHCAMLTNIVKAYTDDNVVELMSNEEIEAAFEAENEDLC